MPRTSRPDEILPRLFGSVARARILELLVSQAGKAFYQREIMYETGLSLQQTQRELKNLLDLGIIRSRETVDRVYYEIDPIPIERAAPPRTSGIACNTSSTGTVMPARTSPPGVLLNDGRPGLRPVRTM